MLGAIAGDVISSVHEHARTKRTDFPLLVPESRFTDDTVLTVATANALLTGASYADAYHDFGNRYFHAGYGKSFHAWIRSRSKLPYGSWGNGSAMRVSPVGWAARSVEEALLEAERSAAATHDHPEGIRGAQAVSLAVFLARTGQTKEAIRRYVAKRFRYDLARGVDEIRATYRFDVSCQGSVPEALIAFMDAKGVEDAIRLAISLGGDADTQASIAGAVAEAYSGEVPPLISAEVRARLPAEFLEIADAFSERYPVRAVSGGETFTDNGAATHDA